MNTKMFIVLANIVTFFLGIYLYFSLQKEEDKRPLLHKIFPIGISVFSLIMLVLTYLYY
jgi:hypothetical protein